MKVNSVSNGNYSNTAFSGSIKITQKTFDKVVGKHSFVTDAKNDKLLANVLNSFAPQVSDKPKYIIGSQIETLNKCINYVTDAKLKTDAKALAWIENMGNNVYKFFQGSPKNFICTVLDLK